MDFSPPFIACRLLRFDIVVNIYDKPDFTSPVIAKAEDEVIGSVKKCPANSQFCLINFGTVEGWVPRSNFYGVYPKEEIK